MAEDVLLNPTDTSGGAVVHTDELSSGAHVQRIKVGLGDPGVYSDVSTSNPFPVTGDVSVGNTVTVTGTVTATPSGTQDVSVGNTVTVTGTVTANAGTGTQSVSDGAVVSKLDNVSVTIVSDGVGIGGGTQYSEGTAIGEVTGTGNLLIATRDDALSALSVSEGQAVRLRTDGNGALWVVASPGDAETTDGATVHSLGVTRQVNVGFISEPNELSVGANTIGMAGMDSTRALWVHIKEDSAGIGGGTQYSVGTSGLASAGVGNLMIGVRDDSLTTLASGEGEGVPLRVSATGALHVTGGGGGTEYTEDAAAAANPVGGAILLVRADTPATITDTDGDNVAQRATNYGAAYTQIVNSSGNFVDTFGGGTQYSVGVSGLTSAGTGTLMIATRDDALTTLANGETEAIPLRVDANGALWVKQSGSLDASVGNTVTVAGTVTANPASGTIDTVSTVTNLSQLGGAAVSMNTGVRDAGTQRVTIATNDSVPVTFTGSTDAATQTTLAAINAKLVTGTDIGDVTINNAIGDGVYIRPGTGVNLNTSAVTISAALPAGDSNIGNVDIVTLPASTNTIEVVGDVAHDAPTAGNPVLIAGEAQDMDDTAPPNRVTAEGDATQLATDFDGAVFAHPHGPQIWSYHLNTSSAQTDTQVRAAPGAGLSLYVTDIVFSSGAATAINLFFEESTTTVLGPYYLEAVAGRGMSVHFQTPKKITANTALTFTTSAAIAHSVDVTGYIGQG